MNIFLRYLMLNITLNINTFYLVLIQKFEFRFSGLSVWWSKSEQSSRGGQKQWPETKAKFLKLYAVNNKYPAVWRTASEICWVSECSSRLTFFILACLTNFIPSSLLDEHIHRFSIYCLHVSFIQKIILKRNNEVHVHVEIWVSFSSGFINAATICEYCPIYISLASFKLVVKVLNFNPPPKEPLHSINNKSILNLHSKHL